jgi:hypothetical protein
MSEEDPYASMIFLPSLSTAFSLSVFRLGFWLMKSVGKLDDKPLHSAVLRTDSPFYCGELSSFLSSSHSVFSVEKHVTKTAHQNDENSTEQLSKSWYHNQG